MISSENQDSEVASLPVQTTTATLKQQPKQQHKLRSTSVVLVPISVLCLQQRADDGTCSKSIIESVAWSFIDQTTGSCLFKSSLQIGRDKLKLADAIQQVNNSSKISQKPPARDNLKLMNG